MFSLRKRSTTKVCIGNPKIKGSEESSKHLPPILIMIFIFFLFEHLNIIYLIFIIDCTELQQRWKESIFLDFMCMLIARAKEFIRMS